MFGLRTTGVSTGSGSVQYAVQFLLGQLQKSSFADGGKVYFKAINSEKQFNRNCVRNFFKRPYHLTYVRRVGGVHKYFRCVPCIIQRCASPVHLG
jgi:hypothetical protein